MEFILNILLAISAFLYVVQTIFITIGTRRLDHPKQDRTPTISILVALKDEIKTVKACIESLLRLDYPDEKMEILLIDDRSSDGTEAIIEGFRKRIPHIKTVHITSTLPGLSGKANAIAQSMEHCSGEIILITDGDCRVPKSWAKAHVSYYTPEVGLVGGFTLLDEKNDTTSLFGKIQSLDWAYLLSVGTGAMGFGLPLSVLGNNFSFRRAAYEEVGGYQKMGFTIIEDFALMKWLLKKTNWRVRYPIDPEMLVFSHPMPDLKRFYSQRKRWSAGGKEVGFYGKFLMAVSYSAHILLPLAFIFSNQYAAMISALCALLIADLILLFRTTGLIGRRDLLRYFPLWEVFYFAYTSFFAPVLLFPTTVTWKNTTYKWNFNWTLKRMFEKG